MDPVDENLGLNDGDETVLLVDGGVADQTAHGLIDGVVGGGVFCHVDAEGCAPLGDLGPADVVGDAIIVEAIEAAAPGHALVSPHKGLEA